MINFLLRDRLTINNKFSRPRENTLRFTSKIYSTIIHENDTTRISSNRVLDIAGNIRSEFNNVAHVSQISLDTTSAPSPPPTFVPHIIPDNYFTNAERSGRGRKQ